MTDATCPPTSIALSYLDQALEFRRSGQIGPAKMACLRALQADDKNPQALLLLGDLEFQAGNHAHAETHIRSAIALAPNFADAHERLGALLQVLGQAAESDSSYDRVLQLDPDFSERHNQLGLDLQEQGYLTQAIAHYRIAVSVSPELAKCHHNLGIVHAQQGEHHAAIDSYRSAIRIDPGYQKAHSNLGIVLKATGQMGEAISSYLEALKYDPSLVPAHNNLGNAYRDIGQFDDAIACFRKAIELDPGLADAHLQLSYLKTFEGVDDDVRRMQDQYADPDVSPDQKILYAFGLAKIMEDLQDYDEAFGYLQVGNRLKRQSMTYSIEAEQVQFENTKKLFNQNLFDQNTEIGASDLSPVFIIGMPRSGTTLIEQILSSHPLVYGAGELETLRNSISFYFKEFNNDVLYGRNQFDDPERFVRVGQEYLRRRAVFTEQDLREHPAELVTDKMPDNFRLIGMIKLILPNAKIIHCTRNPMATCLSIYKQLFAVSGLQFSYDLVELGQYYKMYQDLMAHWHEVLPGFIYDVSYEDLIADQETQSRALIAHCGLQWDPQCLNFHTSRRVVRTASATQVRKPIYQQSLALWEKYDSHLGPLKDALA